MHETEEGLKENQGAIAAHEDKQSPVNAKKGITITHILDLKNRYPKMTMAEAGAVLGCSAPNIHQHLQDNGFTWEEISEPIGDFNKRKADILANFQRNVLNRLMKSKIDKASFKDLVLSLGILIDKEDQIRGNKPVEGTKLIFQVVGDNVTVNTTESKQEEKQDNQEVIDVKSEDLT
jgi:hypothetical protein